VIASAALAGPSGCTRRRYATVASACKQLGSSPATAIAGLLRPLMRMQPPQLRMYVQRPEGREHAEERALRRTLAALRLQSLGQHSHGSLDLEMVLTRGGKPAFAKDGVKEEYAGGSEPELRDDSMYEYDDKTTCVEKVHLRAFVADTVRQLGLAGCAVVLDGAGFMSSASLRSTNITRVVVPNYGRIACAVMRRQLDRGVCDFGGMQVDLREGWSLHRLVSEQRGKFSLMIADACGHWSGLQPSVKLAFQKGLFADKAVLTVTVHVIRCKGVSRDGLDGMMHLVQKDVSSWAAQAGLGSAIARFHLYNNGSMMFVCFVLSKLESKH